MCIRDRLGLARSFAYHGEGRWACPGCPYAVVQKRLYSQATWQTIVNARMKHIRRARPAVDSSKA
eukprot:3057515-Alexandrium_andersonii.AAC.1